MVEESNEFDSLPEVIEPDMSNWEQQIQFSHEQKVSAAYDRCSIALSQDIRPGYLETKTDKSGNQTKEWKPDTREVIINSVHTLKNVMINEIESNKSIKELIDSLFSEIESLEAEAILQEDYWFKSLPISSRNRMSHQSGYLNKDLIFFQNLMNTKVEIFREVFQELEKLLFKQKYLKKKAISN